MRSTWSMAYWRSIVGGQQRKRRGGSKTVPGSNGEMTNCVSACRSNRFSTPWRVSARAWGSTPRCAFTSTFHWLKMDIEQMSWSMKGTMANISRMSSAVNCDEADIFPTGMWRTKNPASSLGVSRIVREGEGASSAIWEGGLPGTEHIWGTGGGGPGLGSTPSAHKSQNQKL